MSTIPAFWKITADHGWGPPDPWPSREGWTGPCGADTTLPLVLRVRLLYDEGELAYEGLCADTPQSLDYFHEFGMADVGATNLEVYEHDHWVNVY